MKTKYLLSFALLLGVLAFGQGGCGVQLPTGSGGNQASSLGVDFSISEPIAGDTIIENSQFNVVVTLRNYGTIPVSGIVSIEDGVGSDIGGIGTDNQPFNIDAAHEEGGKIVPETSNIKFPGGGGYSYKNLDTSQLVTIGAKIEYSYVTNTRSYPKESTLCIGRVSNECSRTEKKSVNTATPLSITTIEKVSMSEEAGGAGFRVKIHLRKKFEGTLSLTTGKTSDSDNKIFVNEVSFGNQPLRCDNVDNGVFEIRDEGILVCDGVIGPIGEIPLKHPLIVELGYVVKTKFKTNNINIEKRSTRN